MHVNHLSGKFASCAAIADAEMEFRARRNGFERSDIATARTQLGELCEDAGSVKQGNLTIREKRKARSGSLHWVAGLGHDLSSAKK
jgi:hypothetical protein